MRLHFDSFKRTHHDGDENVPPVGVHFRITNEV